jgi:hypothetical protein
VFKDYGANCDYIRKTFGLSQSASIYDVVSVITKAYKELYETTQMAQAKTEESTECQKPKVRKSKKS